jgi:hypothetical protein
MATTRWRPEMWLRPKRVEVLPCQSLLLHAHCAPLRITTRTVIESVKSTWTRDDSASLDLFDSDSRSKLCRQDALPDRRSRLLITTRLSTTGISPFVIEQPFLAPQTAAVPAERSVGSNHPMARDDDANHVRAIRATNCATRIFIA